MRQEIPENMFAVTHCWIDGTELLINNINRHTDGHVYMICPKCNWQMSIKHKLYPDIDNMLGMTDSYADKLMYEICG